jgi:succinate dehydrogenase / fumarate reductase flavoprotein subunit
MSESLRNDGRIWVPRRSGDNRSPDAVPESDRYYFLEEKYPSFGNLVPRDVASRNAKQVVDEGLGVGPQKNGVYLDFSEAMERLGRSAIEQRYGNLFDMYHSITGEDPYAVPMRIYPAVHYTMGGLWVDYQLQSNVPGLFVLGEANFSDHGANRLGASALMQGLADGYFIAPYTIGNYLAGTERTAVTADAPEVTGAIADVRNRLSTLLGSQGRRTALSLHRELGQIMWEQCGMARTTESLSTARTQLQELRESFWNELYVPGDAGSLNQNLEFAGRVADLIELGELLVLDALHREESCGGHFREESQTADGEAKRNDEEFSYVAGWTWQGEGAAPMLRREPLAFEAVRLSERSYS